MNKQETDVLNECKTLIIAFKKHLSIINGNYLSHHIVGVIRSGHLVYYNQDRDWYYKDFCADLDEITKKAIGIDKQTGHYYVATTYFRDYYLYDLINGLRIETKNNYTDNDEVIINELENKWKSEIAKRYQRNEHLRRFVWDLKPFTPASKYSFLRNKVIEMLNSIIPNNTDFYSFTYCGLCCKCLDDNDPNCLKVKVTNSVGLFGDYVHYGQDKTILPDQKIIEIPSHIYAPGLREYTIVGISKGVFESLHNAEVIRLPWSIEKLDWSFWHCRKLKAIEIAGDNDFFCSQDGVLYSHDKKVLYAYPNMHGNVYEVPEGTEIIEKFAFKDCNNIKVLILPCSLKHIKINAFYRAVNLKMIICDFKKQDLIFEGYFGDFGDVSPKWFFRQ